MKKKTITAELKYKTADTVEPDGAEDYRTATLTEDGWMWSNGNYLTSEELFINETAINEAAMDALILRDVA